VEPLYEYLDDMEDVLDASGKANPFSTKIAVDKGRLIDIISDIRMSLPNEFKQAQRTIADQDKIIAEAKNRADNIIRNADAEAKALASDHEIFRRASEDAVEILDEAKREAKEYRLTAVGYVDDLLEQAESQIKQAMDNMEKQHRILMEYFHQTVDVIYENRQELRGR